MNTLSDRALLPEEKAPRPGDGNLRDFYLELARRTCLPPGDPENSAAWLWRLYTDTRKTLKLFTALDTHTVADHLTSVQHACSYYLVRHNVPMQERLRVIDTLADWSSLSMNLTGQRPSIVRIKEECVRRLKDLKDLLGASAASNREAGSEI